MATVIFHLALSERLKLQLNSGSAQLNSAGVWRPESIVYLIMLKCTCKGWGFWAAHRAINNIHDYENLCGVRFRTWNLWVARVDCTDQGLE